MRLLYKPFAIVFGLLGGITARRVFQRAWLAVDGEPPPQPTKPDASLLKVLAAAALEGLTFNVTRAAFDRLGVRSFHHLFGVWPQKPGDDRE